MHFPVYIRLGGYSIHPHLFFESVAYVVAAVVYFYLRKRYGDKLAIPIRWTVVAAAVAGGAIGAKVLFWFEDPRLTAHNLSDPRYLLGGKTIVGGLLGGLVAVKLVKRYMGVTLPTGDLYAVPLALGIAIGRIGCFLTGIADNTYGMATNLPWGINFGDGTTRHPTQLYEVAFLLLLLPILLLVLRHASLPSVAYHQRVFMPGDVFNLFMVTYLSFRFFCDFLKPYPRVFLGLGGIQWACLLALLYYASNVSRWARSGWPGGKPSLA